MHPAIHFVPRHKNRPPVVVTFHDLKAPYLFPKAGRLRWKVVQMLALRADGIIVTNVEDEFKISSLRSPISNLARIPIGSNIAPRLPGAYDRDAWRARWRIGPDDLLLGYFGFLNERKGGEDLVEVLATLVARGLSAHLLFIGGRVGTSDPTNVAYAKQVDRLIAEQGLSKRVHYTEFVPPEEVSASLEAVDVCVLPYRDGVSLRHGSMHACLAHGRPIITTQPAVATPEFRDGENMLLAPPEDIAALADSVARLASDTGLRERLERGAAALSTEFTWDRIAARTAKFFAGLIT
jgi:glycosyltransferase involved in cell wall biosynthesis